MLLPLVALTLFASADASRDQCLQVQQVQEMAVREGFPVGRTLQALEARFCMRARNPPRDDCLDLWMMTELAYLGGENEMAERVNLARSAICAGGAPEHASHWPNGPTLRSSKGSLYFPNGTIAKSGERWSYPNGVTALDGKGRWFYPNGVAALAEKTWYAPSGTLHHSVAEMLSEACQGTRGCGRELDGIAGWEGHARIMGIIRIAWDASQSEP